MKSLAIYRCPVHDFWAVMLDDSDGGGTRLTPSKCCGRWEPVKTWKLSTEDLESISEELVTAALEQTECDS